MSRIKWRRCRGLNHELNHLWINSSKPNDGEATSDKLKQGFWNFTGLNFKWKHEHKQRDSHFARQGKVPCQNAIFARWIYSWCENMALRIMSNSHCEIPLNPLFLHARTTDFPNIFSLIFSHVNSFCNLVFSRHKALSCNFSIYRGAQHLQKRGGDEKWDDWGSILCTLT